MAEERYKKLNAFISSVKALDSLIQNHLATLKQGQSKPPQVKLSNPGRSTTNANLIVKRRDPNVKQKVTVFVKIIFLKISAIDTIHDRYAAEVMVQLKWREPLLDDERTRQENRIDLSRCWNPKVSIANGIGEIAYKTTRYATVDNQGKAWICEKRQTPASHFFEYMELHKFPFDSQDLTITVTTEREDDEVEFVSDGKCAVNAGAFSAAQEWQLNESISVWTKVSVKTVHKQKLKYPCFCVAAKVTRRPQFFIYNVIVIMFAICSLSFATFTVKLELPESRLPLTFLLVLTTVTFKFVVNKSLPKISYLTYLDKYILGSMVILCCTCMWQSISGSLVNGWTQTVEVALHSSMANASDYAWCPTISKPLSTELGRMIDFIVMGTLAFIYVAFHAGFLLVIYTNKKQENSEIDEKHGADIDDESDAIDNKKRNDKPKTSNLNLPKNKVSDVVPVHD